MYICVCVHMCTCMCMYVHACTCVCVWHKIKIPCIISMWGPELNIICLLLVTIFLFEQSHPKSGTVLGGWWDPRILQYVTSSAGIMGIYYQTQHWEPIPGLHTYQASTLLAELYPKPWGKIPVTLVNAKVECFFFIIIKKNKRRQLQKSS